MSDILVRERLRLDNPSAEIEQFTGKDGETYFVLSNKFYDNLDNSGVDSYTIETSVVRESDGHLSSLAKAKGSLDLEHMVAELSMIAILNKDYLRLGFGSKLLEFFERSALNHGIRSVVGVFAPFNDSVASSQDVYDFYEKNGYGFCKLPLFSIDGETTLIYKNFDIDNEPKPAQEEDEYFGSDDYRKMLSIYKKEEEINQICGLDDDLFTL